MANGVRINNLNKATSLNDTDTITIIQDDENKKASISLFDKDGTYTQSVVNTIPDLITTSKTNVETTKQAIDEKFGYDKFSAQIVTSQEMSSVGVSDDGSVDVNSQVQDGFMESATLYGKTQYHDTTADVYYDSMPEDTTGMTLELVSVKMPILHTVGKNLFNHVPESLIGKTSYGMNVSISNGKIKITGTPTGTYGYVEIVNCVEKGKQYTFSAYENGQLATSGYRLWVRYSDGTLSNTESGRTFVVKNLDIVKVEFVFEGFTVGTAVNKEVNIQIEESPTQTAYEPYKSSILSCNEDVELGSVGNVRDELNLLTCQLTKRTEIRPYQNGDDTNSKVITDMNNTRYKLDKEVIKTVDLNSSNGDVKTPVTYKNGHVLLQSDGLIPELHYSIPVSYSGLIAQNTMTNLKHSWRLDELEIMAYTSIVNSHYESLILVATAETNEVVVSSEYVPDESLYNMLKVLVNANALENADEKINVFYLYGKLSDEMYIDLIIGDDM